MVIKNTLYIVFWLHFNAMRVLFKSDYMYLGFFSLQSEAPLLIRPFISKMTRSELHAICTGGFATIAGSVMAAYILYKVQQHTREMH